ncbi:hypothetical protein [Geminicoccus flavidas]|uniref:hypothetical protein n=1 Tax=Geminicoccus flavidas TaxID=2506407 RepID=UPI0013579A60|nr:hypothetical protein [Geminicoccus flavidas]
MLRNLMFGAAALALVAFASPANAQVALPGVEIEGPISQITVPAQSPYTDPSTGRSIIGEMKVMGATIRVLESALVHTPGASGVNAAAISLLRGLAGYKEDGSSWPLPGRGNKPGFIGGTAIVVGESINGVIYANDVFSDMFENVIVGEATGRVEVSGANVRRMSINGMPIVRSADTRIPAAPPINGFGLRIRPNSIVNGTLASAEGYYGDDGVLYYHALEADSAELVNPDTTQVSILRASCRVRGGGRDELEVRGGTVNPANASVQIRLPLNPDRPNQFTSVGIVQAVPDNTVNPPQGLYRADFRNLNIPTGVCPSRVRAVILETSAGALNQATATADLEGR